MSATRALAQTLGRAAGSPVRVGDRRASDRRHDERRASRLSERGQRPRQGAPIGPPHGDFVRTERPHQALDYLTPAEYRTEPEPSSTQTDWKKFSP